MEPDFLVVAAGEAKWCHLEVWRSGCSVVETDQSGKGVFSFLLSHPEVKMR